MKIMTVVGFHDLNFIKSKLYQQFHILLKIPEIFLKNDIPFYLFVNCTLLLLLSMMHWQRQSIRYLLNIIGHDTTLTRHFYIRNLFIASFSLCMYRRRSCLRMVSISMIISLLNVGLTGLFCPCVLFGRNVASLNEDISQQSACVSHAICVEGGIALAVTTAACHGIIDPDTACLLTEGLLFAWWVCGIYTGMSRQLLQRKYHLKVINSFSYLLILKEQWNTSLVSIYCKKRIKCQFFIFLDFQNSPCDPCMVHCCLHWCAICQEHREMKNHLSEGVSSEATVINPPPVQEMNNAAEKQLEKGSSSSLQGHGHNNLQLQAVWKSLTSYICS